MLDSIGKYGILLILETLQKVQDTEWEEDPPVYRVSQKRPNVYTAS